MSQSNPTTPGLKARLQAEVKRDPKKAAILGVLVLVFLIVAVRMAAKRVGSPKAGSAAARPAAATPETAKSANGATNVGQPQGADGDPVELANVPIDRDIFTPSETYFPIKTKQPDKAPKRPRVMDPNAVARAKRLETEALARDLTLQTTMVGKVPTAVINGRILRIGSVINGFKVIEINTRSCQLEKDGVRVLLEMEK